MDERIRTVLDYIESHLSEKLNLKELAAIACMSPENFHRIFKKETNQTPFKFIEEIKMNKAHQLLIVGSKQVSELTTLLGYNDYETFSRAFKKYYSIAPDDLKAISQRIKSEMKVGPEHVFIKVFEDIDNLKESLNDLVETIKNVLLDRGYTEKEINDVKVLSVLPKMKTTNDNQLVVKNKFIITEEQKIWPSLLKTNENASR